MLQKKDSFIKRSSSEEGKVCKKKVHWWAIFDLQLMKFNVHICPLEVYVKTLESIYTNESFLSVLNVLNYAVSDTPVLTRMPFAFQFGNSFRFLSLCLNFTWHRLNCLEWKQFPDRGNVWKMVENAQL